VKFLKFALVWYSQQFAIPFWIVGHVHLSLATYSDAKEIIASLFMHLGVACGFWLDYRKNKEEWK
jgi:hypothetical protein